MDEIKFYKAGDPYGFLSNFSKSYIFIDGKVWPTVEHYFQSCKFDDEDIIGKIRGVSSPMKAAIEGRNKKNRIRADWDIVKDGYMLKALYAKFFQNPELRSKLLLTGDSILIEDTVNDKYWASGGDGSGENKLGLLLIEVRKDLNIVCNDIEVVLPPWIAFPEISSFDLFWRMGFGENYLTFWSNFFEHTDKKKYIERFQPTEEWEGFYDED